MGIIQFIGYVLCIITIIVLTKSNKKYSASLGNDDTMCTDINNIDIHN